MKVLSSFKLVLLLFLLVPRTAKGQNLYIGLKGGTSQTNVSSENFFNNTDYRTGFSGGITSEYFFSKKFSVGADVLYSQRGFTSTTAFTGSSGMTSSVPTFQFEYDYVSVPLKANYTIGNKLFGFGGAGLVPAILVNATQEIFLSSASKSNVDVTSSVTKFDLAGLMEIGGGYDFGRMRLFTSLGYQYSFTTLTNSNYFNTSTIHNYGLTWSFGLKYQLKKKA